MNPQTLRKELCKQRLQLNKHQRLQAAKSVTKQVCQLPEFRLKQYIAFYLPVKGELNPLALLDYALSLQKKCYLPILHPLQTNLLHFCEYKKQDTLLPNRYGILEPAFNLKKIIPTWALDCVFVPLVGFDKQGNRLGMGGGFYDRTFAFKKSRHTSRPYLIGLAYQFQKTSQLVPQAWDVPMDLVITEELL